MRLLNNKEIANATYKRYKEVTGDKAKPPIDFTLASALNKAQQELTNEDWRWWLDTFLYIDDHGDYRLTTNFDSAWQARLKEIGNEPQV